MTTIARLASVVATLALASVTLAGVAAAADPASSLGTVGGRLGVSDALAIAFNQGTLPVTVTLSADSVTLDTTPFILDPGEEHSVPFTGKREGHIYATFQGISNTGMEVNAVSLAVTLKDPPPPPFDWTPVMWVILLVGVTAILMIRFRPWRLRVTRVQ